MVMTCGRGLSRTAMKRCAAALCSPTCLKSLAHFLLASFLIVLLSIFVPDSLVRRHLLADADSAHRDMVAENERSIQASQEVLEAYKAQLNATGQPTRPLGAQSDADVGLTVLTTSRGLHLKEAVTYRTQYLTQSVARLLTLLNDTSLTLTYHLAICNVDEQPDRFEEATRLEELVPTTKRFGSAAAGSSARTGQMSVSRWEKLKHDYVFCLQDTLAKGARYALLVEDDALAHDQMLHVLEHVVRTVVTPPAGLPVVYVKFFHPRRLLGYYSLEVERLTELTALSLSLGAVLALTCRGRDRQSATAGDGGNGSSPRRQQLWASWVWWAALTAVGACAVGRANLLELRRLSVQLYQVTPTPSCCTPAMMFTRQGGSDISRHLLSVTCTSRQSTDFWIDEFRHRTGARAMLVQPNLFTHIGMVSSLRDKEVDPLFVAR